MSTNKITKVYSTILKQELSLEDYMAFRRKHPYANIINSLKCVECGDDITFASGQTYTSYFKHRPSFEGHDYCSLYTKGTASGSPECKLRKKLFHELDVTLNFELFFYQNRWEYLITIPSFSDDELIKHEENNTKITITTNYGETIIGDFLVNRENFIGNKIRIFSLSKLYENIILKVSGDRHGSIRYRMDVYQPERQIYKSLINQNYPNKESRNFDSIGSFSIKKTSGSIYVGKHYILILSYYDFWSIKQNTDFDIELKEINFSIPFDYSRKVYDVVFNSANESNLDFCSKRGCLLKNSSDALVIWPPIRSIGNYKYIESNKKKMYILYRENQKITPDLLEIFNHKFLTYHVDNKRSNPYYIANMEPLKNTLPLATVREIGLKEIKNNVSQYQFRNNVLINYISDDRYRLSDQDTVLRFETKKSWKIITKNKQTRTFLGVDIDYFLDAVRYSYETIQVENEKLVDLKIKYSKSIIITDYLDYCIDNMNWIKRIAYNLLIGGE